MMEIKPILSTLLRNKTGAVLIALQIALTMAVVVNAVVVIQDRAETIAMPTGVDVDQLIMTRAFTFNDEQNARAVIDNDLAVLGALPGVQSVTKISTMPLSNSGSSSTFRASDADNAISLNLAYYQSDVFALSTLGLEITRGRWFRDDEVAYDTDGGYSPTMVVLSDFAADTMYPDEDPVGKFIYNSLGDAVEVIGTYDQLSKPWYGWGDFYSTAIFPMVDINAPLVLRVDSDQRDALIPMIDEALTEIDRERLVGNTRAHTDIVANTFERDVAMNRMLTVVMTLVVIITALGIVGLASFSVMQRRKQIGTRRAIGAQRFHILRYFLTENWMITTFGIVLGLGLTFALNSLLINEYNLPKLDPIMLPLAVLGLWAVGLLATIGPARNAAAVDPAIATRSI
ncbi:MAG: FtsX-like permease family protein [Pseudomonadota bacterium]